MIVVGTNVKITARFTNESGVVVDPDTVTFYARRGDDEPVEITSTRLSQGVYEAEYQPTAGGQHAVQAQGAGVAHSEVVRFYVAPDIADVVL